jgi:hypothetical protein
VKEDIFFPSSSLFGSGPEVTNLPSSLYSLLDLFKFFSNLIN